MNESESVEGFRCLDGYAAPVVKDAADRLGRRLLGKLPEIEQHPGYARIPQPAPEASRNRLFGKYED